MRDSRDINNFLDTKRLKGDIHIQPFVEEWLSDEEYGKRFYAWLGSIKLNADLNSVPAEFGRAEFLNSSRKLPEWADRDTLLKGSRFFTRHSGTIMSLLGLLSLPYCYAAADGAMVLYLTERLRDRPAKRLSDTADFIWDVMAPDAFNKEGKGFASCMKIRLTHSLARHYVSRSNSWTEDFGMPVNQEDMAGTNLAFSLIVVRGLRKLGMAVSYEEQQSFMHLWNVVGSLLGLDEDLIPQDGKSATLLENAIRERHFRPSLQGKALTRSLLDHVVGDSSVRLSPQEVYQIVRFLLGDEVADILEVPLISGAEYAPAFLKVAARVPRFDSSNVLVAFRERHAAFLKARN
ncbi:oxygenase MpaB family protein [Arcticibacter sp.]|uniref:oxygenase MpaB family protein n=1 Tax=Arcticibacter sp. TaxID=1872630 RepID=UPI00388F968C